MKNLKLTLAFPVMIVLSIPFVKYLSKTRSLLSNELFFKKNTEEKFDLSLRNFHPNKGE
ncbi:MAG: hypothetical protein IPL53_11720 [Ignavibacteria bacterium]|nr:hypothetical protein [Ignavibacteria bacterium]